LRTTSGAARSRRASWSRGAQAFLDRASRGQNALEPVAFRFERNGRGQVGVFGRLRVRGPEGLVDTPAAWIYSVADGKIRRADSYTSMVDAQRALYPAEDRSS
jgi:ketosteroid isomerase-like protein